MPRIFNCQIQVQIKSTALFLHQVLETSNLILTLKDLQTTLGSNTMGHLEMKSKARQIWWQMTRLDTQDLQTRSLILM